MRSIHQTSLLTAQATPKSGGRKSVRASENREHWEHVGYPTQQWKEHMSSQRLNHQAQGLYGYISIKVLCVYIVAIIIALLWDSDCEKAWVSGSCACTLFTVLSCSVQYAQYDNLLYLIIFCHVWLLCLRSLFYFFFLMRGRNRENIEGRAGEK